jgi:hypothetical protein
MCIESLIAQTVIDRRLKINCVTDKKRAINRSISAQTVFVPRHTLNFPCKTEAFPQRISFANF